MALFAMNAPYAGEDPFVSGAAIPSGPLGDSILLGREILRHTGTMLPDHVGNSLSCTNCHLGEGRVRYAAPFIGLWRIYPTYNARIGRVITLKERINQCFERSLNGRALEDESPAMQALVDYVWWLSQNIPTDQAMFERGLGPIDRSLVADVRHGIELYQSHCALCHGQHGEGQRPPNGTLAPPLWGERSFNLGAGMARTSVAAAFIKHNMPLGHAGSLADQDAMDIAAFLTQQPRPGFAGVRLDWPAGGRPVDAPSLETVWLPRSP